MLAPVAATGAAVARVRAREGRLNRAQRLAREAQGHYRLPNCSGHTLYAYCQCEMAPRRENPESTGRANPDSTGRSGPSPTRDQWQFKQQCKRGVLPATSI
jgi:hypothetical protein